MTTANKAKATTPRSAKKASKRKAPVRAKTSKKKASKKKATKKKTAKRKAKKNFTVSVKRNWRGLKYTVINITDSELVSVLQRVMTVEEDYSRRSTGMRWYVEESELRIKFRRLQKLLDQHPEYEKVLGPLNTYINRQVQERLELFQQNVNAGFVTFDDLWLLYYEGQEIVFDDEGALVAGEIHKAAVHQGWGGLQYAMTLKIIVHNGKEFIERDKQCTVPYFEDGERILNLPVRPVTPEIKKKLGARGATILDAIKAGSSYVYYQGEIIERSWWGTRRYRADGRGMLDPKTHKKMNENYSGRDDSAYEYVEDEPSDTKNKMNEISVEDFWRMSPWIPGFSFAAKQWGEFNIELVQEVPFNTDAFDQLVLPTRQIDGLEINPKKMIRSLVEHGAVGFTDVIADKGGGIIFLLHGPPGTGKTLTAEAIADLLKRPLYSVSVGELGTKTSELEKNLRMVLEVATLWNAVLLIDEADIFLEKRTPRDIERNALVAIFLRMLEYYQGVLFLTTNRVQQFDPAFNSRLSIALDYPEHGADNRERIWNNLLLAAGLQPPRFDLRMLANEDVNGRQIKHAIRIGLSLAANEKRTVTVDDFMKTIKLAQHFNSQLGESALSFDDDTPKNDDPRPTTIVTPPGGNGRTRRKRPRA